MTQYILGTGLNPVKVEVALGTSQVAIIYGEGYLLYHSDRKCKGCLVSHINNQTLLTFPTRVVSSIMGLGFVCPVMASVSLSTYGVHTQQAFPEQRYA